MPGTGATAVHLSNDDPLITFGDGSFSINVYSGKATGSFSFSNFRFNAIKTEIPGKPKTKTYCVRFTFTESITITGEMYERKELGKIRIPVAKGLKVIDLPLETKIEAEGSVTFSKSTSFRLGVRFTDNQLPAIITNFNPGGLDIQAEVKFTVSAFKGVQFKFIGGLIQVASFEVTIAFVGSATMNFTSQIRYGVTCVCLKYYVSLALKAEARIKIGKFQTPSKFVEWLIWGPGNSRVRGNLHIENSNIVSVCTMCCWEPPLDDPEAVPPALEPEIPLACWVCNGEACGGWGCPAGGPAEGAGDNWQPHGCTNWKCGNRECEDPDCTCSCACYE